MKRTIFSLTILAILTLRLSAAAPAAKADFSGTWKLDTVKSSGLPPGTEQTMTVTQTGETIKIETKLITEQGEQNISDKYSLDGKEMEFTANLSESTNNSSAEGETNSTEKKYGKGKVTAKRTADGIEIKKSFVYSTQDGDSNIQITRKWTIFPYGKTLSIDTTVLNQNGTLKSRHIFNKK